MISSDWQETLTSEDAEREFQNRDGTPFKFKGVGWYSDGGDILLVIPSVKPDMFEFYCWNSPEFDPITKLLRIAALPRYSGK